MVLDDIDSNRRFVHPDGLARADVVFVPLEDGDRCEALVRAGRQVITVDLNPLSRTAQKATMTIVDNVTRAMSGLVAEVEAIVDTPKDDLLAVIDRCDNAAILSTAIQRIRAG